MECGIHFYGCVFIILCISSQVSGDITMEGTMLRFESRLSHLELVVFSMKASLSKLNGRLDKIEMAISQQHLQITNDNANVFSDSKKNVEHGKVSRVNKVVIDAFISEKAFIRNTITEYEEQFTKLQNTVHDQILILNSTLDASQRRFGQTIEETEQRLYSSLEQHKAGMDLTLQGVRRNITVVGDTLSSAINNVELTLSNQLDDVNKKIRNIERETIPVGILLGPEILVVEENDDVSLHCEVYGNPKPTVTWRKGSQPLTSEYRYETFRNGTLLIRSATERDIGSYTCTADNGVTSPVERTIKLHVELAIVCDSDQFKCADSSTCIAESWRCDGDFDCPDRSDETTDCHKVCNSESEFKCISSYECIHKSWKCDGDVDCSDASDEQNCKHP